MTEQTEPLIEFTPRDIAVAQDLLGRASESPSLPTLSDEEIVALDGIKYAQAVVLPWLSQFEDQKELLCNVALRTLLTKGVVFPVTESPEAAPNRLAAGDDITGVMTLRRSGQRAIIAEVAHGDEDRVWLYSYLHGEFALQELIDSSGIHNFSLRPTKDVPASILELAGASGIVSEPGDAIELSEAELAAIAPTRLADVRAVANVVAIGEADAAQANLVLYVAPERLDLLTAQDVDGQPKLTLSRSDHEGAVLALTRLLGEAR